MKQQELVRVLQAPVTSEKSANLADKQDQYVFKVKKSANSANIKRAVEAMFDVKVERVNVMNVKGKIKRHGRFIGVHSDFKKAYIKLKPGFKIELSQA